MQFLTPEETIAKLGPSGFSINDENGWYRRHLMLDPRGCAGQKRLGCRGPGAEFNTNVFARALIAWLNGNAPRLLWIDRWDRPFLGFTELFLAARLGLGEARDLTVAPGHYVEAGPYQEWDHTQISPAQLSDINIMCSLISLVHLGGWDGWLVAEGGTDRIEFWECYVYFHSSDPVRLADAEAIMTDYRCERVK